MKKSIKWLSILLILVIILSACGNGQKIDENNEELPKETNQLSETSSVPSEEDSQGIEVDKKLLTVDVTLPEQLVGDLSNFDEKEYLAENEGIKSARVNDDGSLTLTMTKSKHKEMLEEVRKSIDESFGEFIEGDNTSYIKTIDYTENYRDIMVGVDREAYENSFDLTPFFLGISAGMYQSIAGIEYRTTITINDTLSGEVITSVTYPDAFE
ncbi:MAG: hypothetical protein GX867_10565 [Tissierellia bacterium]|jgi:hypothetical protein|nr:hypothetical protein [Sedimentibacter sp.]NLA14681.1 hypothetical protein [Tissierellia bacterium]HQK54597.1 hypothetical protein [Sedimentibacter sp.]